MKRLICVTGASGTGKTTAVEMLAAKGLSGIRSCHFDSIGIPSTEEMISRYGTVEEWQRAETIKWIERIKKEYLSDSIVIFDGSTRPSFLEEGCKLAEVADYKIVVFVCEDRERDVRVTTRGQSELANPDMSNWNAYLKREGERLGSKIIDTTHYKVGQASVELESVIRDNLKQ